MTPDPYQASGGPGDPQSWNRYAYAGGDAANRNDPFGQDWCDDDDLFCLTDGSGSMGPSLNGLAAMLAGIAAEIAAQVQAALQNTVISTSCDVQVFAQPAGNTPFTHTFIETTEQTYINGVLVSTTYQTFQATPQLKGTQNACTTDQIKAGQCWLNNVSSDPITEALTSFPQPPSLNPAAQQIWDSGFSSGECATVGAIQAASGSYPNNKIQYLFSGYTSNSFTYTLLKAAGVPTGDVLANAISKGYYGLPFEGWGEFLPIFP